MPQHQRESIIQIILEETKHGHHHRVNILFRILILTVEVKFYLLVGAWTIFPSN